MKRRTHQDVILEYLEAHAGITSMEAFELFGITRLSAVIWCLKKKGYEIETVDRQCTTRYGSTANFSEYRLKKNEGE